MRTPHTGSMSYDSTVKKIPHASVTAEDAMMIRRMINCGEKVRVTLKMSARMLPDAQSFNVMGELRGREKPDEIVAMGDHIDSWDVGQGAMDDAGGVPVMGLNVDGTRYFWFHHTDADTPDKLDRAEVQRCVAAMAVMAYIVADLEQGLPR